METNLRPVWNAILDVYNEFAKLCERHHLRYWVAYGTLLGAVRHKGFIPWDDDFDVHMPREDYEAFLQIAEKELPHYLKVVNWKNTPEFDELYFGKIQDMRREIVETVTKMAGRPIGQGIFIDIFPMDGYSYSKICAFRKKMLVSLVKCRMKYLIWRGNSFPTIAHFFPDTSKVRTAMARAVGMLSGCLFSKSKNQHDFAAAKERWMKGRPYNNSPVVCCHWSHLLDEGQYIFPSELFGVPQYLEFENYMVPAPHDYKAYLRAVFGDYMKLPPPEQRKPGHVGDDVCPWVYGPTTDELPY